MKTLLALLLSVTSLIAAPPVTFTNTCTLQFTMLVDPSGLMGLTASDYATNFNYVVVSSPNVTTPTNQWTVVAVVPVKPLLSQGPPGTWWTNQIPIDGANRFFIGQYTNISNGGVGPFSIPYPLIWAAPSGGLGATK